MTSSGAVVQVLEARLAELEAVARALAAAGPAAEARALRERLQAGRYFVTCVGQYKRGKSTLLNALVGAQVLPTGVVPVTSSVTVLRHGPALGARVFFGERHEDVDPATVGRYVSEQGNPHNRLGVSGVEVTVPCQLLESGLCLVDTPGLASPSVQNSATTRAFLPQVDAVLLVLGVDPPLSGEEADFVEEAARDVHSFIVVLNKADRATSEERREATAFATRILRERLGRPIGPVFEVSARERFELGPDDRDWPRLLGALEDLAREKAAMLVRSAGERGLVTLGDRLAAEIDERRSALTAPIAECERRLEALRRLAGGASQSSRELGHLLSSEQESIGRELEARRQTFVHGALERTSHGLEAEIAKSCASRWKLHADALELARATARIELEAWRVEEQAAIEGAYRQAAQRFVDVANGFVEHLAHLEAWAPVPKLLGLERGLRRRTSLFYREAMDRTGLSLPAWLATPILSRAASIRRAQRLANDYLRHLLETNAARVMNDLEDCVLESRRQLEGEVRDRLTGALGATEQAIEAARSAHASGEAAVASALATLEALQERLTGALLTPGIAMPDNRPEQGAMS